MHNPVDQSYHSTSKGKERQLRAYGIDERYLKTEKQSGKDFERSVFLSLVGTDEVASSMRAGDCLVVCSLDRLGRNYEEIQRWWRYITKDLKCSIVVLDMPLLNTKGEGTAYDLYLITGYAYDNFPEFLEICSTYEYEMPANSNYPDGYTIKNTKDRKSEQLESLTFKQFPKAFSQGVVGGYRHIRRWQ